jgi:hypothetical protein
MFQLIELFQTGVGPYLLPLAALAALIVSFRPGEAADIRQAVIWFAQFVLLFILFATTFGCCLTGLKIGELFANERPSAPFAFAYPFIGSGLGAITGFAIAALPLSFFVLLHEIAHNTRR